MNASTLLADLCRCDIEITIRGSHGTYYVRAERGGHVFARASGWTPDLALRNLLEELKRNTGVKRVG